MHLEKHDNPGEEGIIGGSKRYSSVIEVPKATTQQLSGLSGADESKPSTALNTTLLRPTNPSSNYSLRKTSNAGYNSGYKDLKSSDKMWKEYKEGGV